MSRPKASAARARKKVEDRYATLPELARAIAMSAPGQFALLFATCNVPAQRERMAQDLRALLARDGVNLIHISAEQPEDVRDFVGFLKNQLASPLAEPTPATEIAEGKPAYTARDNRPALSVHGLEAHILPGEPYPPLMAHLNLSRERFRGLGCPLVLWLPDYLLTRVAREAPDFWAWRSGVFRFAPEPELVRGMVQHVQAVPGDIGFDLSLAESRKRMALLESLLSEFEMLERSPENLRSKADLLLAVGNGLWATGDAHGALQKYEQALAIARQIGDRSGEGNALGNLGLAYAALGDPKRAIAFYQQALTISREIGDKRAEGQLLGNLGLAYADLGNPKRAIAFYQQHLAIARQIGDRSGEGNALGNLGLAYADLGNPKRAIEFYQQALAIARQIGDRSGEGNALGNLGLAYAALGDPQRAIEFYQQRLAIAREIGDRRGEAIASWNMGLLLEKQGDYARAAELMQICVDYERAIGHPDAEKDAKRLARVRAKAR